MQRAAAAGADRAFDVEPDLFARQMVRQRFATRTPFARPAFRGADASPPAGEVAVDVFERERQLIGIKALGQTAKLRPLQRLDDRLPALDLAVAVFDGDGHIANEMLQKSRFGGQIVKIEPHVQSYPNRLIRGSGFVRFYEDFRGFLACQGRLPYALRRAPVDALDQHGELRRRQRDRAFVARHRRPNEGALVEPLGE